MTKSQIQEFGKMDVGEGPRHVLVQLTELQKEPAGQRIQGPPPFVASNTTTGGTVFDPSVYPSGDLSTSRAAGATPDAPPAVTPMGSPPMLVQTNAQEPISRYDPPAPPPEMTRRPASPPPAPPKNTPAPVIASSKPPVPAASTPPSAPPVINYPSSKKAAPPPVVAQQTISLPSRGNQTSAVAPAKPSPSVRPPGPSEKAGAVDEDYSGGLKYRIGPEDILRVSVWDNKELTLEVVVRPDGKISLPLIQDVQAEGLTASELSDVIHQKLLAFMKEPQVTVIITQVNAPKIFVIGNVAKPGPYPLRSDMSVLQALSLAGGFTPFASPKNIKIVRNFGGGKQEIRKINYFDIIDQGEGNYLLRSGDTIVVP
jgi:polysaccharide export outer membrane protein